MGPGLPACPGDSVGTALGGRWLRTFVCNHIYGKTASKETRVRSECRAVRSGGGGVPAPKLTVPPDGGAGPSAFSLEGWEPEPQALPPMSPLGSPVAALLNSEPQ